MIKISIVSVYLTIFHDVLCQSTGVGLSISQLNDIKNSFDEANINQDQESNDLSAKNIYQNKYHNFSEKFSLEDRLLLVRLYNRYTEEHCMTFRTFARKFKKKANEWINNNKEEHMWERENLSKRRQKSFDLLQNIESLADLESFTEQELLALLESLDKDETVSELESQFQSQSNDDNNNGTVSDILLDDDLGVTTNATDQRQGQEQSQQVLAEIHTHNHYYLIQKQDGSIQELSSLTNTDPAQVAAMLNSTTTDLLSPPPVDSSDQCSCSSGTSGGMVTMYPSYTADPELSQISLTTSSPDQQSSTGTSQVAQTTLPPVEVPGAESQTGIKKPQPEIASLPASASLPQSSSDTRRNGVFSCSATSSGMTTNFVNPSYPNLDSSTGECKFTLQLQPLVCQVRVDFVDTRLLQPQRGVCSQQSLSVSGDIWPVGVASWCGLNSGQHFYAETVSSTGDRELVFTVNTQHSAQYKWGLWITQIQCDGTRTIQAPTGCFQYYFDTSGLIQSYNYDGGQYYSDQHYRVCIRTSNRACQVEFTTEGPFMLEKWGNFKTNPYTRAGVTSQYCVKDYLQIPGAGNGGSDTHDRFCGGQLSTEHGARTSQPLVVSVKSPLITLEFHSGTPLGQFIDEHHRPGFRIRYQQQSCV